MLLIPQEWKSIFRDNQIEKLDELSYSVTWEVSQKPFVWIFYRRVLQLSG
jgi:hypothetical protein